MNGNFEVNKELYPYGMIYQGAGFKLTYVPTLTVVHDSVLPSTVIEAAAAELNARYWGGKGVRVGDETINEVIREQARLAYEDHRITGVVYDQIKARLEV